MTALPSLSCVPAFCCCVFLYVLFLVFVYVLGCVDSVRMLEYTFGVLAVVVVVVVEAVTTGFLCGLVYVTFGFEYTLSVAADLACESV